LTLIRANGSGLTCEGEGMEVHCDDVLIEQCQENGIHVNWGSTVTCNNVEIRECGGSGFLILNGSNLKILLSDKGVHDNGTNGSVHDKGICVSGSSSKVQIVAPLSKEQVSTNNGFDDSGNWCGNIEQIHEASHVP